MLHVISVQGLSARSHYLSPVKITNFQSMVQCLTAGPVFAVSSPFKTDLFYESRKSWALPIRKLWAFYEGRRYSRDVYKALESRSGRKRVLNRYFDSLSDLSMHPYQLNCYLKSFRASFDEDPNNRIAKTLIDCDQHVMQHFEFMGLHNRPHLIEESAEGSDFLVRPTPGLALKCLINDFSN